jgi:PKD repeat protein
MNNKLNNLDQIIKDTYETYEVPYDPSHWDSIEKELDSMAPSPIKYFSSITTGLVAASLVFMSMLLFVSEATQKTSLTEMEIVEDTLGTGNRSGLLKKSVANSVTNKDEVAKDDAPESESDLPESPTEMVENGLTADFDNAPKEKVSEVQKKQVIITSNDAPVKSTNEHSASSESTERSIRTGCTGLTIDFEASKEYGRDAKYLWNFGDGFFSNEANPSHTFNKPGTFDVSLSVTSYTTGQITSNVVQAMIDVVEAPVANMDFEFTTDQSIVLKNKSFRADQIEWFTNGNSLGYGPEVNLNIADNTRYDVQLSAISAGGCTDTLYKEIYVSGKDLGIPKSIHISKEETLTPSNFASSGKMIQFVVLDNAGKLKFQTAGNQVWSGEGMDGQKISKGNYQWIMATEDADEITISKGEFTIL